MKRFFILLVAVTGIGVLAYSCSAAGNLLGASEFSQQISQLPNEVLLDVRTPAEYASGHIEGALNIDWNGNSFTADVSKIDKSRPVLVYCKAGGRSASAAGKLNELGFKQVIELKGGFDAWNAANFPVSVAPATETGSTTPTTGSGEAAVVNKPVSKAVYLEEVRKDRYTLVDFAAAWCGPCRILAPRIDELQQEMNNGFTLMKVDADRDTEICDSLRITALPTLVFYKNGKQLWRQTGLLEKSSLEAMIKQEMK